MGKAQLHIKSPTIRMSLGLLRLILKPMQPHKLLVTFKKYNSEFYCM